MAVKSNNTQGNPYHDEKTGEFTKAENSSLKTENIPAKTFRLKANFDINSLRSDLKQTQPPSIGAYKEANTIEEAISIGKSILPGCLVNYSNKCDITKVNELNKALGDVANKFPMFVENGLLNAYGDGLSINESDMEKVIVQSALNVIKNDKHFSKIYDDFFNQSKIRYDLKDTDKYSQQVFSHFMCFDKMFNFHDYTKKFSGGGALAYYQVTQDNIFNRSVGGKGINGAIKFYTSTLLKATPVEIEENDRAVKIGFHFDYGQHSYTYASAVHELGHSIFTIAYKKCNEEERMEIDRLLIDGRTKDRREVSGYGHTNDYEQEAEAVADGFCRGNNATPHNRKMFAWLEKVHNRLSNGGN